MFGIIDIEKSDQSGEPIYLFFIVHPPKCAGTKFISEMHKHRHLEIRPVIEGTTHARPSHVIKAQPSFWKRWGHLPIYIMTRHPYERFESQMGFIPAILSMFGPERFFTDYVGGTLFRTQWSYMTNPDGEKLGNINQIKLENVTGTVFEIEGLEVDMRNELWTQRDAEEKFDTTGYPRYIESNHSKEFVQEAYPNDFENLGYHK